jgi:L,D-peptidoglycan transpeptidase YkuD (ErfK/YbiS/YcfS/YnhG family)
MKLGALLTILLIASQGVSAAPDPLSRSRQCIVVVAPAWSSTTGFLRAFERGPGGAWQMRGTAVPVVLGKRGLAWGIGLVDPGNSDGPRKIEGDNKVPAGIFRLGPAFGYAPAKQARWIRLPYVQSTSDTEGVDDPRSRYYNRLVDRSKVARIDWRSSEKMLRADDLYKWGLVVAHNPAARPSAGSCIFLHIWKNANTATTGCTAMAEPDLVNLLRWLDSAAGPILVQMPRREFEELRPRLGLPGVP